MWWLLLVAALIGGVVLGWLFAGRRQPPVAPTPAVHRADEPSDVERRLLRIVEALPQGILVFDDTGAELFSNAAAARLSGDRLHDALVSSTIAEVVAEASRGLTVERMLEVYSSPRSHLAIRGVPVEANSVVADAAGRVAVVVTVEDATDLRSTDLMRRDFVANVSHELKTPIGAIGVLAETLLDVDDPDVARRLAGRLQNEAFRLSATVDDLLTLARIESGEQIQLAPVRLDGVFSAVVGRVATSVEAQGIDLVVGVEPQTLAVMGDRVQLITGIANVVDNAVKYSGEGSTVRLHGEAAAGGATITVEDHGIGIPEVDLERVFERFYRVDRARGRETGGTGLGLSIVRNMLLNHGGSIEVESVEGEGTTFVMSLPTRQGPDGSTAGTNESMGGVDVG